MSLWESTLTLGEKRPTASVTKTWSRGGGSGGRQ
eukprot:COSAG02_NODE_43029_length_378_cov_5.695341_1_plen_33_part_10